MNKLVGAFVIIFEFFIQSSICLTCYVCNATIFNRNACSNSNNLQSVICYPGRGCMVKYDSFGNPIQMGCNDESKYPVDFWGWPECVENSCPLINLPWPFGRSKRHSRKSSESHESNGNSGTSTVCTCSQSLCNSAGVYNNVTQTPKINCLSCNGASACNSNSSKTVQCLQKDGCGVTYDVNKTAITRGCGGGLPLNAPGMTALCLRYNTTMLCSCIGDRCNAHNYENQPPCSNGWTYDNVTKKCYIVSPIINGYANASNYCITNGGSLVSIHSLNETNFITNNIVKPILNTDNTTKGFYIGLRWESSSNHTWVWEDGTPTDFFNWLPGQPDGKPSNATYPANIVRIIGQPPQVGYWDDINDAPTNTKRAICQT